MNTVVEGLNVHYIDTAPGQAPGDAGDARQTVLFLHGWNAPVGTYTRIFEKLAPRYRVVAFDMPGCGGTDQPLRPLTVEDYARFTLAFCDQIGLDRAIVMCHSHGGRVACRLLSDENCPLKCEKSVWFGASGVPPVRSAGYKARLALYKALKALGTGRLTKPLFGRAYVAARERRSSADYRAASEVMRQTMSNVLRADLTPLMPRIRADVLLVWGEHDTATPLSDGQVMEKLIPRAGLAVVHNAGHYCFLDNWPQFSAILDAFLP